jgi:hypothetical protein
VDFLNKTECGLLRTSFLSVDWVKRAALIIGTLSTSEERKLSFKG